MREELALRYNTVRPLLAPFVGPGKTRARRRALVHRLTHPRRLIQLFGRCRSSKLPSSRHAVDPDTARRLIRAHPREPKKNRAAMSRTRVRLRPRGEHDPQWVAPA